MTTASWDQASRCYKCGEPGVVIGETNHPSRPGSKIKTLRCDNERCRDYDANIKSLRWSWIVQVDSDGNIPVREAGAKEFNTSPAAQAIAERNIQVLQQTTDVMEDNQAKEIR